MTATTAPAVRLDRDIVKLASVLLLGLIAPLLDSTIVNVAIHTLAADLHASVSMIQWVSTGYLLAMAAAIPITGWATDRYGGRRMWLLALTLFLAGSVLSGAAWNVGSLVAFRVIQGLGTGLLMPIMQTLLFRQAGGRTQGMGKIMAIISLPMVLGPVLGPVIGGLIIEYLPWRWIFFVNPPICLAALVLAWRVMPADTRGSGHRLDVTGLLTLSPALAAIIYGLSRVGDEGGFGHPGVLVPLLAGLGLLGWFIRHALRTPDPIVDLRLFRARSFATAAVLLFLSGLASFGAMLLLPLYYQQLRGQSVVAAGLLLAPQGLGVALSRAVGGVIDRVGTRPVVIAGVTLLALGTLPFAAAGPHTSTLWLATALVVRGTGLGAVIMAVMLGANDGLRHDQVPHASSASRILQQLGGSFGTAALAVILQRQLAAHPGAAATTAFDHTFAWAFVFTLVAIVPALLIPSRRRPSGTPTAADPPELRKHLEPPAAGHAPTRRAGMSTRTAGEKSHETAN